MGKRVRGLMVGAVVGVLGACGAPDVGDAAAGSAAMRRALECQNCPSPHRIENEGDPSGCGVGETCNPPGAGGTKISCTDGSTSHDGNTCDGVVAAVAD
ncbi:MAG TPA: hypothetical protein VFI53_02515 [Myxococcaceae bacterium]|nr:hypothetical protein [Myxococcaceae bacterium]